MDSDGILAEIKANPTKRKYARADWPPTPTEAFYLGVMDEFNRADDAIPLSIAPPPVSRDTFLLTVVAPAALALAGMPAETQAKWDRIIAIICAAGQVDVQSPVVAALMAEAVKDKVLTAEQVAAAAPATRSGSRAEQLWGAGAVVTLNDLAKAGV